MKKNLAKLTSLLLVIALLCTFMVPVSAVDNPPHWWIDDVKAPMADWSIDLDGTQDGIVHSQNQYILFTSDLHRYTYLAEDLLAAANNVAHADGLNGNIGLFSCGGDFANEYTLYADNMSILKDAIATSEGTVATYTKGNHESDVTDEDFIKLTGMSRVGETCINDSGDYYFYNFGVASSSQAFEEQDIKDLETWLGTHNDGKPIFIVSHFPLHYYNDRRVSKMAADVVNLLNGYPQVVFLWGHNHTESDPAYGVIRTAGDIIQPAADEDTAIEINFTYANLGALRDGTNGANGLLARVDSESGEVYFRYINLHNSLGTDTWTDYQGNENTVRYTTVDYDDPSYNIDGEAVTVDSIPDLKNITKAGIKIARPLVDQTPDAAATAYSGRFTSGTITWTDAAGKVLDTAVDTFDFATQYTATVTLTADTEHDYHFDPNVAVSVNKSYIGPMPGTSFDAEYVEVSEDGSTATISYTFAPTTAQGEPKDAAAELVDGNQYVLAAIGNNYAASYMYNPADHGEESKPTYTVADADIVIREGQLVSALAPEMIFTAQKDAGGYLLCSDASLEAFADVTEEPLPTTANFLNVSSRGGDLGLEAAETIASSVYCDWNIDEAGRPYVDIDGGIEYAAYTTAFTFVTDPEACNVRLYEVGTDTETNIYSVNVNVTKPVAGAAASADASGAAGYTVSSAVWSADAFEAGYEYTVTVTAVPDEGRTFHKSCTARVNGEAATMEVQADGSAVITYTFTTPAASGKRLAVSAKAVDTITSGKTYVLVSNGVAMTASNDGVYGSGIAVTEADGAITSPITSDMLITLTGDDTAGYSLKTAAGYIKGKTEGDKPDAWGLDYTDSAAVTVSYTEDGCLKVVSTGPSKGKPKPGGATNYLYENNGHFNYFIVQQDAFTLYEVSSSFTDISGYSVDAIEWAAINGVSNGTNLTTFAPKAKVTRAEAITMLWRAAGCPAPAGTADKFVDVKAGSYYADAVAWAVETGITNGTNATHFSPNADCTRAQIITFLYRFAGTPAVEGTCAFVDVAASAYYADAVTWAAAKGISNGTNATHFTPNGTCTREQAVTFLYRYETK